MLMHKIQGEVDSYLFWCPGCECAHAFNATWQFDGNMEKPTVRPSLLSTYGEDTSKRCHMFITNGVLEYLGDCSHALKGQKVPMVDLDWEEELRCPDVE